MLIFEPYESSNSEQPLIKVYSDAGFFIKKGSFVYKEAIVNEEETKNFVETNTPIPASFATNDYILNAFIHRNNISIEEINNAIPILEKALRNLSDEEAYLVKFLFKEWNGTSDYEINDRVWYNNKLYTVISKPTDNINPEENLQCFVKTTRPDDLIEEWTMKNYRIGDKVKIGQHYYENLIENNNWSPLDFPTSWRFIK